MALAVVVLKYENLTPVKVAIIYISIDFKFDMSEYVPKLTNPAKFGSGGR